MGKKHRGRRRQRQRGSNDSAASVRKENTKSTTATGPAIVQKLRHADAPIRQAALAVLYRQCSNDRMWTPTVLQAIRDRIVLDTDIDCVVLAVECLASYFDTPRPAQDDLTAGWLTILVHRLHQHISTDDILIIPLLVALNHLLQNNPLALGLLLPSEHRGGRSPELRNKTLRVLGRCLQYQSQPNDDDNDVALGSARALHTILDDNVPLVVPLLQDTAVVLPLLQEMCRFVTNNNSSSLLRARLHVTGALLSCWRIQHEIVAKKGLSCLFETQFPWSIDDGLRLLRLALTVDDVSAVAVVEETATAYSAWKHQQDDEALEHDVVKNQQQRQEPARHIARRLKQQKTRDGADATMQDDDAVGNVPRQGAIEPMRNSQEAYDVAQDALQRQFYPCLLALEIIANLTTRLLDDDDGDGIVHAVSRTCNAGQVVPTDLQNALSRHGIFHQVYSMLRYVASVRCTAMFVSARDIPVVQSLWDDMLVKACAGLSNSLANNVPLVAPPLSDLLNDLLRLLVSSEGDGDVQAGLSSCLAVAMQARPAFRQAMQPAHLQSLLALLLDKKYAPSVIVQRDIVCVLGTLCCTEPHPQTVNEGVCRALVQCLQQSTAAVVVAEVLNVLMDIYGDDDCHPNVFEQENVLAQFQRALPELKRLAAACKHETDPADVEHWQEVASNAARFIQYKKGYA